jgi:DNA-directed RNA polymerase specialized sigma24 family protein
MPSPLSDKSLLRRYCGGDAAAAVELHDRYARRMRGLAKKHLNATLAARIDVDDIVQSALGSFFRNACKGLYQVPESGELWRLLAAITRHKLNHARVRHLAAKRDIRKTVPSVDGIGSPASFAEQLACELKLSIDELLVDYSAIERRIVELRIEGHEIDRIAEVVVRSRRTVERVLQQFRSDLCREL